MSDFIRQNKFFSFYTALVILLVLIAIFAPYLAVGWAKYARLVRSLVIKLRHNDYIIAAQVNGTKTINILWRHVLPLIVITSAMDIGTMMMEIAGLSFLGNGA